MAILPMPEQETIKEILRSIRRTVRQYYPKNSLDIVLYGDYALGRVTEKSKFEVMILCDASREEIRERNYYLRTLTSSILLDYNVFLKFEIENRDFFQLYAKDLPEFRRIVTCGLLYRLGPETDIPA